ncbi:MAG: hypothetical protein L6R38_007958 [Xanthoria sp. 2 TBL-2021]|nr:MAG: hypothetical protein L6R38_007958 [Xanthoria sp. 2 TBL-2021]
MSTDIVDTDSQETFNWRHDMNEGPAKAKVMKRTQHPGVGNKRPAKRPQTEWKACQDQMTAAANIRHHVRQVDLELALPCAEKDSELLNAAKSIAAKHVALADLVKARPSVAAQQHSSGDILEPFVEYTSAVKHLAAVTDSDSRSMRQLQDDNKRLQQLLATNEDKQQDLQRQISSLGQGKIDADKVREKESTGYQELKKQWKNMVGNNTNLQHRAEGLELRISELERERDKKKATAEDYRLQYDDLLKRAHGLRKRKDMLQVDFDAALKKGAGFEQQITDLAGEKNILNKTIQSMEASLKQRDEEIQASASKHDTLVREHERQIADLVEEQARFNKTMHTSLEQKDEKVRAFTLQYDNLVRKHERQTRKVETMYAELFEAAARENQLELDLQQSKAGSKNFSDKATAVEAKNNRLLLDLEELESRLKKTKSDVDQDKSQLQRNLAESNLQRQNALALAAQHEQTIVTQATEKNSLEQQLQDLQTRLDETKGQVLDLPVRITEIEHRTPGEAPKETRRTNGSGDSLAVRNREPLDRESSEDSVGNQSNSDAAARFQQKRTGRAALDATEKPASKRIKTTANQSATRFAIHLPAPSSSRTQAYLTNISDDNSEQDPDREYGRQRKRTTTVRAAAMPNMVKKTRAKAGKAERPPLTRENKNSDPEPWIAIDQFRQTTFAYGDLPQALFDQVRQQMNLWDLKKGTDSSTGDWKDGAKGNAKGRVKCAHHFAIHEGSDMELGHACEKCEKRHLICVGLLQGQVQLRSLLPRDRGKSSKADMAYWVRDP